MPKAPQRARVSGSERPRGSAIISVYLLASPCNRLISAVARLEKVAAASSCCSTNAVFALVASATRAAESAIKASNAASSDWDAILVSIKIQRLCENVSPAMSLVALLALAPSIATDGAAATPAPKKLVPGQYVRACSR